MSRYKSIQTAYCPPKKKDIPIWRLDTNTLTVTHFNTDTLTEKHKTNNTDYIRYHIHYLDSKYPDRLRRIVNEGKIEHWKKSNRKYQAAVLIKKIDKMLGLENCLISTVRERI